MKEIVFASANRHKVAEAQKILGPEFHIILPTDLGFEGDIPEDHETIYENSVQKAQFIWDMFRKPCFADDTGLEVDALGGAPGVYSARYAGTPKNMARNIEKLLRELAGVPEAERTAHFHTVVSYIENGELTTFDGWCYGRITTEPSDGEPFGYDPVFLPVDSPVTMAQMTVEEKNAISHRGMAMDKLVAFLKNKQ